MKQSTAFVAIAGMWVIALILAIVSGDWFSIAPCVGAIVANIAASSLAAKCERGQGHG